MLATIYEVWSPHIHDVYIGHTTDPIELAYERLLRNPPKCMNAMVQEGEMEIKTLETNKFGTMREYKQAIWRHKTNKWKFCVNRNRPKGLTKKYIPSYFQTTEQKEMNIRVANSMINPYPRMGDPPSSQTLKRIEPIQGDWTPTEDIKEDITLDIWDLAKRDIAALETTTTTTTTTTEASFPSGIRGDLR